jgi:GNAT superfamily N-acetyltransferase
MAPNLLLLSPPMRHPFTRDLLFEAVAEAMEGNGMMVFRLDAGNDFYRRGILDPDVLRDAWTLFLARRRRGDDAQTAAGAPSAAETWRANEDRWRSRFSLAQQAADLLAAGEMPALSDVINALASIDDLLSFLSAVFSPLRLERDSLVHPALERIEDVAVFCRQENENPFSTYARSITLPGSVDAAFCLVRRPDQVAVVATLLRVWRQRWPKVTWAAIGVPSWVDAVHAAVGIRVDDRPGMHNALWRDVQRVWGEKALAGPHAMVSASRLDPAALALAEVEGRGATVRLWHDPRGAFKAITAGLYRVARGGAWNHLVLPPEETSPLAAALIDFAAGNPGIIHSWCRQTPSASPYAGPRRQYPRGSVPYGGTAPLPGLPVWQILRHPELIAAFVERQGLKSLAQSRHDPGDGSVFALGRSLVYTYRKPEDLPEGYLDEICRMVEAGGSVATRWVRHNLQRAFLIVYVEEYGVIVGNSSLKHPRAEYIEAVSAQSGIDLRHYLERGYTSVRPEYRGFGIGAEMLAGLTRRAGDDKIFSVIGEDNIPTQKMAIRNRTRKVATFYSVRAGKQIGVWIPEWMLPEGIDLPPRPQLD